MPYNWTSAAMLLLTALGAANAYAQANDCNSGGRGDECTSSADCESNSLATICISSTCQIPCTDAFGDFEPGLCTYGEACIPATTDGGLSTFYCQAGSFSMDLNLLDTCVSYFVDGVGSLPTGDSCSLTSNLNLMLDSTGGEFDIFDVEACIRAFLFTPACDQATATCSDPADIYCNDDTACGYVYCESEAGCPEPSPYGNYPYEKWRGMSCNTELHRCERHCGLVGNRENASATYLERPCFGYLQTCDESRGRCVDVDLDGVTCQVDSECPAGAYCLLGQCVAECFRNMDCPPGDWYCDAYRHCAPTPSAVNPSGSAFDPDDYAVHFGQSLVEITEINDRSEIPFVILNRHTRREERDNPAVSFGYRLQLTYLPIQNARCDQILGSTSSTPEQKASCLLDNQDDPKSPFLLDQPFGALSATGSPAILLRLDHSVVDSLEPGTYQAQLEAVFTNGTTSKTTVVFHKQSLSGTYSGQVSVYLQDPNSSFLGNSNVDLSLFVDDQSDDRKIRWFELAAQENIETSDNPQDMVDTTEGFPVYGFIDGNSSAIFDVPGVSRAADNRVPVKGIYSPDLGRMHLVGVIDLEKDHCRTDTGACSADVAHQLSIRNFFGRKIRRQIHFIGPYDPRLRRFHGIYRETIKGMGLGDVTFDGGFILNQIQSGMGPGPAELPSTLVAGGDVPPAFPDTPSLIQAVRESEIAFCGGGVEEKEARFAFGTETRFGSYVSNLDRSQRILPNLVHFEDEIRAALDSLEPGSDEALTIFEFLQGRVFLCSENPDVTCINANQARCGLALQRRAMLEGWVEPLQYGAPLPSGDELFCAPGSQLPGCNVSAAERAKLIMLQEHNRFYSTISQALRYQAASDISDAFYLLYRKAGEPIAQAQALSEKQQKLLNAWGRYDQLLQLILSPVSTKVMLSWPMGRFKGKGSSWLAEIHAVMGDRLDALRELVDLKRRLFVASGAQDFLFVQDLLHLEYLAQAYLMHLQSVWQGEGFSYAGHGPRALEDGQRILAQINETRNPLGFHPNQIFFENSDLSRSNWHNYLAQIRQGGITGLGLLGDTKAAINEAISEMRGALSSKNSFEAQLLTSRHGYEDRMDQICGPCISDADGNGCPPGTGVTLPTPEVQCMGTSTEASEVIANTCTEDGQQDCAYEGTSGAASEIIVKACTGDDRQDCPYEWTCAQSTAGEDCHEAVLGTFVSAKENAMTNAACRIDTPDYKITIGSTERACVRGQIGALLQEKALLEVQTRSVLRQVQAHVARVENLQAELRATENANAELVEFVKGKQKDLRWNNLGMMAAQAAYEVSQAVASGSKCSVIVGLANGGDCLTAVSSIIASVTAIGIRHGLKNYLEDARMQLQFDLENESRDYSQNASERQLLMQLENTLVDTENLIGQYEAVMQQLFNLEMRINDSRYLAQQAANHYQQSIGQIIDHLLGTEQGSVLRSNLAVQRSNDKFAKLLRVTYRMAAAFVHRYNLQGFADQIYAQVFQIVTAEGIEQFVDYLEAMERDYCGAAGIDCDAENNVQTLRVSLREELFPDLHDIPGEDGRVVTAGQQFHNTITSTMYRKKRVRGPLTVEQIEIPFAIWLNDRPVYDEPSMRWMVSPLECNHIIAGRGNGTIGVNVVGTRLDTLRYELFRDNTDSIRGCELESSFPPGGGMPALDYPINTFVVGYAPQSTLAQSDEPPTYQTRSGSQAACLNRNESSQGALEDESCFRYFARDRSLGANDWKLVIPVDLDGNGWIMGEGLSEAERPIIEDIVLYFRYRSRPTSN